MEPWFAAAPHSDSLSVYVYQRAVTRPCRLWSGFLWPRRLSRPRPEVAFTSNGTPELKRYLSANPGQVPPDVWTDIPPVNSRAKERLGYPTQKPSKLLGRTISASCPPDGVVLDPFCGCATTCVAAETLGRGWAGIDLSPMAVTLVGRRLREHHGVFGQIIDRTDIPPGPTSGLRGRAAETTGSFGLRGPSSSSGQQNAPLRL